MLKSVQKEFRANGSEEKLIKKLFELRKDYEEIQRPSRNEIELSLQTGKISDNSRLSSEEHLPAEGTKNPSPTLRTVSYLANTPQGPPDRSTRMLLGFELRAGSHLRSKIPLRRNKLGVWMHLKVRGAGQ